MCPRFPPLSLQTRLSGTVEGHSVGAAAEAASDAAGGGKRLDTVGNGSRGGKTLENLEVESKTGNVRASHRGTADGVGSAGGGVPGGQNVDTRTEDIDTSAVVGERGGSPAGVDGSNGQSVGNVGRRLARDWERTTEVVTVTGSNDGEDTLAVGSVDGRGPGLRGGATERQVDDRAASTSLGGDVVDSPVETSEDSRSGTSGTGKDLDRDDVGLRIVSIRFRSRCSSCGVRLYLHAWQHRRWWKQWYRQRGYRGQGCQCGIHQQRCNREKHGHRSRGG